VANDRSSQYNRLIGLFLNPPAIISILLALSVHEWAHGMVARRLGDPTAEMEGRLTLNPLAHLDPLGVLMFVFAGFGWGKPVPVNPFYFRSPKRDTALVSLAGPASNFFLAWIAFIGLLLVDGSHFIPSIGGVLQPTLGRGVLLIFEQIFRTSIIINLGFMAFNLLPIAPLDGSKILRLFIPRHTERSYDDFMQYGPFLLLFLLIADRFTGLPLLFWWVDGIAEAVLKMMSWVAGWL